MLQKIKIGICLTLNYMLAMVFQPGSITAQNLEWGYQSESHPHRCITTDPNDNSVYVSGTFLGLVDFDPGSGLDTITSLSYDGYLTKFDSEGNYLWTHHENGPVYSWSQSINSCVTDSESNVFIAGDFSEREVGAKKLTSSGVELWSRKFSYSTSSQNDFNECNDLALDPWGNTIISGYYWGNLRNFTPNPLVIVSAGNRDGFIFKIDTVGNMIWGKSIGGVDYDEVWSVATDDSGNVYCTGLFEGTCDFDPDSAGVFNLTTAYPTAPDIFILKLNSEGDFVWAKVIHSLNDVAPSIDIDSHHDIILSGTAASGTDFDPGPGVYTIPYVISGPSFILKLDTDGQFKWVKAFKRSFKSAMLNLDTFDNILQCGSFISDSLDLDPGPDSTILMTTGYAYNGYFVKLNQNGLFLSGGALSPSYQCSTSYVFPDNSGDFYVAGIFRDTIDIDPSAGFFPLITTPAGSDDAFFAKYDECRYTNPAQNLTACGSLNYNGQLITSSGLYYQTYKDTSGCDSVVVLNVTILDLPLPEIIGDTLMCINGSALLGLSNTYSFYNWSNGATSNSITVNTPGIYYVVVMDANGCTATDSVSVVEVTYPLITILAQSATTFCQGDSVVLSASPGLINYQWYRRNYAIPGATSMNYIAKSNGRYKCIAQNTIFCADTSNLIIVHVPCIQSGPNHQRPISISEDETLSFQIFPNPGNGIFSVQSPPGKLQIFNSLGMMIYSMDVLNEEEHFDISEYSDGIYFVTVRAESSLYSYKLVLSH